jgi:uncharacterized protein (TIGR00375 family)
LSEWAKIKGVHLLSCGDFTHPVWFKELRSHLKEASNGLYIHDDVHYILGTEVSTIYKKNGRTYKIHHLLFVPDFSAAEKLIALLSRFGRLLNDGRPTLRLDSEELHKRLKDISSEGFLIPSHAWTPHFGVFGSKSGFNSLEECFGDETRYIFAIETGLSSDPAMNWRLSGLDRISLISNSDAHSAPNIGREANVFDMGKARNYYAELFRILREKDKKQFLYTVEFFPEEGKYHYDGHRQCKIRLTPKETIRRGGKCPVCGKKVTVGVMHRVEELADRPEGKMPRNAVPFKKVIPLKELIADALDKGKNSKAVDEEYFRLIHTFGSEFGLLLTTSDKELRANAPEKIAEGIIKMKKEEVSAAPGYDGEYGTVHILW